jgi:hypothetical protein
MNAKEAKLTAQKRADEIKRQREEREQREAEAHAKEWREEKANWLKYEMENFAHCIKEAVDRGQTSTKVHVETHDKEEWAEEKTFWKNFAYRAELKKVIAHFEELGYTIEYKVKPYRNVDLSDLSPRDDWYTYQSILEISW